MAWERELDALPFVLEYKRARHRFFKYRRETSVARKVGLALTFAALTGLAAQIRIPLPFSPVPVTGQTFAVLLAGIVLGKTYGGLSQGLYAGIGVAGVPWFAGLAGGIGVVVGPTGGYIIGFVVAAAFVGWLTDRYVRARRFTALVAILLVANFGIIHVLGLTQLYLWLSFVQGGAPTIMEVLSMGTLPFIPGDVAKLLAAAAVGKAITPKEPYVPSDAE